MPDSPNVELRKDAVWRTQEAKSWKDLAQAAYKKQLASKEKTVPKDGLSEVDNHSARKDRLPKA